MAELTPHHLPIGPEDVRGNGELGRVFFLPGSDGRARRISERFKGRQERTNERQLNVYLGKLQDAAAVVDVGAVSTGMGCPSLSIVVTELVMLGARLLLRVGTAGSLSPKAVRAGSLVVATAAVRDEGTSDRYAPRGYPAAGHPDWIAALERAARELGHADHTFRGVVHAKDALYAREFGHGPRRSENDAYMSQLRALGVLASDMETSHLFVLADVHSTGIYPLAQPNPAADVVRAGSLLAVVGDDAPFAPEDVIRQTEQAAIDVSLRAALELLRRC